MEFSIPFPWEKMEMEWNGMEWKWNFPSWKASLIHTVGASKSSTLEQELWGVNLSRTLALKSQIHLNPAV
jgi:hypothetical protein